MTKPQPHQPVGHGERQQVHDGVPVDPHGPDGDRHGIEFGFDLAGEHLWFGAQHPELLPVDLVLPVLFDFVEVFVERVGDSLRTYKL